MGDGVSRTLNLTWPNVSFAASSATTAAAAAQTSWASVSSAGPAAGPGALLWRLYWSETRIQLLTTLPEADVQVDLDRRRPGQSKIVTPRKETDTCQILSGTFEGQTIGTPISIWVIPSVRRRSG